ncbi:MAG: S8 family peptidase [Marinoscillum sp.]
MRYSPAFGAQINKRKDLNETGVFRVMLKDSSKLPHEIKIIQQHVASNSSLIATTWHNAQQLLNNEEVLFIDVNKKPTEESSLDDPNFGYNRIRTIQSTFPELRGSNLTISVKERSYDISDIDLVNKTIDLGLHADETSQHATDMATIISGMGNTSPFFLGVAPGSRLSPSDFNNLLPDDEATLTTNGIYLQNHSYGIGIENYYGVEAAAYDQSIFNEPELVHVFSAGNAGTASPMNGTYANLPFANLTGTFKQAKNLIVVSAVDTALSISEFNSRGPAYDGRLKPELTAYGGRGTSDAAAIASGIVGLLQEKSSNENDALPSAAMIKALLIAGSDDIGNEGIDYYSGYGNINAKHSLNVLDADQYKSTEVLKGETKQIDINIPKNVKTLRMAMSWTDPPAAANADIALIDDIDSRLIFESNQWLPWGLDSSPSEMGLNSLPTRKEDHLNNTEFISIDNPQAGVYALSISGINLSSTKQTAHIAWYFEYQNSFTWDFPMENSLMRSNFREEIFWQSSFEEPGDLSYREVGGEWVTLSGSVRNGGYFKWNTPSVSGRYELKMTIDNEDFISDQFRVSEIPALDIAYNCDDNFGLQWRQITHAKSYEIYEMQSDSMRVIGTTSDTTFVVNKTEHFFYGVRPIFNGFSGARNLSVNYSFQGAFCYLNFFTVQRVDEHSVGIILNLSSSINIKSIEILKFHNDQELVLDAISPEGRTDFTFYDVDLDPGTMSYAAVLHFEDGSTLESGYTSILIEKSNEVTFFPNPSPETYINILSSGEAVQLEVTDRGGRLVLEHTIREQVDFINIEELRAGLYFYRILKDGSPVETGKFVKL